MSKEKTDHEDPPVKRRAGSFIQKDIFHRTSVEPGHEHTAHYMCQFEDILQKVTTLFIIPRLSKTGISELGSGDCVIVSYDVLDEAGLRLFILSQCSSTTSGFKTSWKDPLLYILSNSGGNELMTVYGQLTLCFGYLCGTGVKVYVGGTPIGSVSKHLSSIYVVKDDRGIKTYVLNQGVGNGHQVAVEYIYDDVVAADLALNCTHPLINMENKVVYSIHFDKEASPCPESKALIIGVAVVLFHDNYRKEAETPDKVKQSVSLPADTSISKKSVKPTNMADAKKSVKLHEMAYAKKSIKLHDTADAKKSVKLNDTADARKSVKVNDTAESTPH